MKSGMRSEPPPRAPWPPVTGELSTASALSSSLRLVAPVSRARRTSRICWTARASGVSKLNCPCLAFARSSSLSAATSCCFAAISAPRSHRYMKRTRPARSVTKEAKSSARFVSTATTTTFALRAGPDAAASAPASATHAAFSTADSASDSRKSTESTSASIIESAGQSTVEPTTLPWR